MAEDAATKPSRETSRRQDLLAAIREVIKRSGFSAARVSDISQEAGVSLGLLNYHFSSKEEAVIEAFSEIANDDLEDLAEISRARGDPMLRLAAAIDLDGWYDEESWQLWVDAWGTALRLEPLRGSTARFARGWRAALAAILADGADQGVWHCDDPDDVAGRLVAALDGIGLHATVHPDQVPVAAAQRWARRLVEVELGTELPRVPASYPGAASPSSPAHEKTIEPRWADQDPAGHINHATYLSYLEEGRDEWLATALAGEPEYVVARVAIDYIRQLVQQDGPLVVRSALARVGRTSVRTREEIVARDGEVAATAQAVLVFLSSPGGRPRPLSDSERTALGPAARESSS